MTDSKMNDIYREVLNSVAFPIAAGDVVSLRSGGPDMTVQEINGESVTCRYFYETGCREYSQESHELVTSIHSLNLRMTLRPSSSSVRLSMAGARQESKSLRDYLFGLGARDAISKNSSLSWDSYVGDSVDLLLRVRAEMRQKGLTLDQFIGGCGISLNPHQSMMADKILQEHLSGKKKEEG